MDFTNVGHTIENSPISSAQIALPPLVRAR